MTHILLVILIDIMLCVYGTHSVTLNEGRKDPNKYILYDTSDFNIPLHAGIALLQSYVILAIVIGSVFLVGKLTGRKRPTRSVVVADGEQPIKYAPSVQSAQVVSPSQDFLGSPPLDEQTKAGLPYDGAGYDDGGYSQAPADPYAGYGNDPYAGYGGGGSGDQEKPSDRDPYAGY